MADEWWTKPYLGGPMVNVLGFPRTLYPPDSTKYGKKPSADGPDVIAYKRTVSRAGRWPWQTFDNTFSNAFSHGKGGNVKDSGIAGVQRQQSIDDTGWVGKPTFNALRSIRCPEGPNRGEMAMDAEAVRLINQAWKLYGGSEPDTQKGTVRVAALKKAITQIGVAESPSNSNRQKYGVWYGMNGVQWCAIFASWCFELNGVSQSPSFRQGSRYAYVPFIVGDARNVRNGLKTTGDPIAGDLVCFDWNGDGVHDHVGIFEKWQPGSTRYFQSVEGNTSYANNSNGGQVMRRTRDRVGVRCVFVRVAEPKL